VQQEFALPMLTHMNTWSMDSPQNSLTLDHHDFNVSRPHFAPIFGEAIVIGRLSTSVLLGHGPHK
jgi:hypothetical protein